MEISDKRMKLMREDARAALVRMQEGKSAADIASELYVRALPDKSSMLGDVMAQRIEEIVTQYESMKACAVQDADGWIDRVLMAPGAENCQERCKRLYALLRGVMAMNTGEWTGTDEPDERMACEELEAELRQGLKEALSCCTLGETQMEALAEILQEQESDAVTRCIVQYGQDAHDMNVVTAMIAYIQVQTGAMDGAAAEATIEDVTLGVCFAQDAQALAQSVEDGQCTEEEAALMVHVLGQIMTLMMGFALEGAATAALGLAFPGGRKLVRRILGTIIGGAVTAVSEEAAEHAMERGLMRGWCVLTRSDGKLSRGLQRVCRAANRTVLPVAERALYVLKHPLRALLERISRVQAQPQTVMA